MSRFLKDIWPYALVCVAVAAPCVYLAIDDAKHPLVCVESHQAKVQRCIAHERRYCSAYIEQMETICDRYERQP